MFEPFFEVSAPFRAPKKRLKLWILKNPIFGNFFLNVNHRGLHKYGFLLDNMHIIYI
jgi:hypothetical protein